MTSIYAFFTALANFFTWKTTKQNKQIETDVLNTKIKLKRACMWAQEAIELVEKYATFQDEKMQDKFKRAVKRFRKFNK